MKWISVKDRWPPTDETDAIYPRCQQVIVLRKFAAIKVTLALYIGDGKWMSYCFTGLIKDVTHWMPLPEVPND